RGGGPGMGERAGGQADRRVGGGPVGRSLPRAPAEDAHGGPQVLDLRPPERHQAWIDRVCGRSMLLRGVVRWLRWPSAGTDRPRARRGAEHVASRNGLAPARGRRAPRRRGTRAPAGPGLAQCKTIFSAASASLVFPVTSTPLAFRSNARIAKYSSGLRLPGSSAGMLFITNTPTSLAVWNCTLRLDPGRGSNGSAPAPTTGGALSLPCPASPWHLAQ